LKKLTVTKSDSISDVLARITITNPMNRFHLQTKRVCLVLSGDTNSDSLGSKLAYCLD